MLYLESPVGVGFSYADDPADYITNDDISSQDNLKVCLHLLFFASSRRKS